MADPDDLGRLGTAMLSHAMLSGIGFRRRWGDRSSRAWSIFDPSTFSWERLSFDGQPTTGVPGTSIAPPQVSVWYPPEGTGGTFDTRTVETPSGDEAVRLRNEFRLEISRGSGGGTLRVDTLQDNESLTLDTVVTVRFADGEELETTLAKLWLIMLEEPAGQTKLRAQAPFRASSSWAALVDFDRHGVPFVYDVGTHTTYRPRPEDRPGPPVHVFIEKLQSAKREMDVAKASGDLAAQLDARSAMERMGRAAAAACGRYGDTLQLENINELVNGVLTGTAAQKRKQVKQWSNAAAAAQDRDAFISGSTLPKMEDAIAEMNKQFGVAMFGARATVIRERYDEGTERWIPDFIPHTELSPYMANKKAIIATDDGYEIKPVFSHWHSCPERNTFDGVVFKPELSFRDGKRSLQYGGTYNVWQGYALRPANPDGSEALQLILWHIQYVLADGDDQKYEFLLDWMATAVQRPWMVNLPAIVLKSEAEGTGKNIIVDKCLMRIFGSHGLVIDKPEHLTGRFNSHLSWSVMVSVNEAIWGGDKQRAGAYKAMITDDIRALEQKFRDPVMVRNYTKIIISTNEDWFAPIGLQDRRHAVFDVSPRMKGDAGYFSNLVDAIEKRGGVEAFFGLLLARKVDFDALREPPGWESEAAMTATMKSSDSVTSFLFEWLQEGEVGVREEAPHLGDRLYLHNDKSSVLSKKRVFEAYTEFCKEHSRFEKPFVPSLFWKRVRKLLGSENVIDGQRVSNVDASRVRQMTFGSLQDCRAGFQKFASKPITWQDAP